MRTPAILCLALLLALFGCGGNGGGGETEEAPQAEATPQEQPQEEASADTTSMTVDWDLDDVAGISWSLDSLILEGEPFQLTPEVTSTFQYSEEGRVSGEGGCNSFFAAVKKNPEEGTISIGPIGATKMACDGPGGTQESAYLKALEQVQVVKLQGHGLTLASQDGSTVIGFRMLLETE